MANKYVYLFKEGNASMRELLGGKGANLAEMTNLGLPSGSRKINFNEHFRFFRCTNFRNIYIR